VEISEVLEGLSKVVEVVGGVISVDIELENAEISLASNKIAEHSETALLGVGVHEIKGQTLEIFACILEEEL